MGFDPIGWFGGAANQVGGAVNSGVNAIDKVLGGTGESQWIPTDKYDNSNNVVYDSPGANAVINGPEYGPKWEGPVGGPLVTNDNTEVPTSIPTPVSTTEISAPVQPQVVGEYDTVGSGLMKEERNVDPEDTGIIKMTDKSSGTLVQTPEKVVDISKYYKDVKGITSLDYVAAKDLGDRKTQEMIASGKTPEQALVEQYEGARLAGDVRAQNYYENEWRKANVSNIALSAEYHSSARDSGLPTGINPYEHVADISLKHLDILEGRDPSYNRSMSDIGMGGTFKDMLSISPSDKSQIMLAGANEVSKAERSGDLGPYANLRSFSSGTPGGEIGEGILSIDRMQEIGKAAAGSSPATGWDVHPEYMDKFTPEFKAGLGYGTGDYKDAVLPKTGFGWSKNSDLIGGGGTKTTSGLLRVSQEGKAAKKGEKTDEELNAESGVTFNDAAIAAGTTEPGAVILNSKGVNKNVNSLTNIGAILGGTLGVPLGAPGVVAGSVVGGVVGKSTGKLFPSADNYLSGINERLLTEKGPATKYLENNANKKGGSIITDAGTGSAIGSLFFGPAGTVIGGTGGAIIGGSRDILGITKPNKVAQDVVDTSTVVKNTPVAENSNRVEIVNPTATAPVITEDLSRGSWIDRRLQDAGLPSSGGQNARGDYLYEILPPLTSPKGMTNAQAANWAMQYRIPRHSTSHLKRKHDQTSQKPKPKRFSLESIHHNIVEKSFDIGLVKFTPTSLDAAVKAVGTSPIKSNVKPNTKMWNMGLPTLKGKGLSGVKSNTIGTKGGMRGKQNVSKNIANVMDNITKSSKIKKIKMAK